MGEGCDVAVIGGGAVGVCVAHFLALQGRPPVLLERGEVASGCSGQNAGLIAASHSIPLAAPGVVAKALRWMLDPASPFHIRPRPDPALLLWLWRFWRACGPARMRRSIPLLRELNRAGAEVHAELAAAEALDCHYARRGLMELFATRRGIEEGIAAARLLGDFGIASTVLDAQEVRDAAPGALDRVVGGIRYPGDAHVDPGAFVRQLARVAERRGTRLETGAEVTGFETRRGRIEAVATSRGTFRPREVVLAAGAWSAPLARKLGLKLPLQAAKGYAVTCPSPPAAPALPLLLAEAKVAVTPLGDRLRFAGTLELAGLDLSVSPRRVAAIRQAAARYHRCGGLDEPGHEWAGLRPCTPDGLPLLGRPRELANLVVATGHAMKGMCQAPVAGQLVARLLCREDPGIDLAPLSPDRFR
ncbi:MAG: NAD(P)/FAD-dependent oxidoreductase [Candidatus Brocadiia bacterium]